jgi:hypothetical protein
MVDSISAVQDAGIAPYTRSDFPARLATRAMGRVSEVELPPAGTDQQADTSGGFTERSDISEKKRYETVVQAAQQMADLYAVSDTRFTIFKDKSGQYITRFTSLRDGSITYYPEQELVRYYREKNQESTIFLDAKA